jgi:hypothetical protein
MSVYLSGRTLLNCKDRFRAWEFKITRFDMTHVEIQRFGPISDHMISKTIDFLNHIMSMLISSRFSPKSLYRVTEKE